MNTLFDGVSRFFSARFHGMTRFMGAVRRGILCVLAGSLQILADLWITGEIKGSQEQYETKADAFHDSISTWIVPTI